MNHFQWFKKSWAAAGENAAMKNDQINKSTMIPYLAVPFLPIVIENQNNDRAVTAYYTVKPDTRVSLALDFNIFIAYGIYSSNQ